MALASETIAYQHAFQTWTKFHAETTRLKLGERFLNLESTSIEGISEAIRILPPGERLPVAFGVFLMAAGHWNPSGQAAFLGEFLPCPSEIERGILETARRTAVEPPAKLPVTLEEFPSRLWKRAMASGHPDRLIHAAHQSVNAIIRLHFQYEGQGEPARPDFSELEPGEEIEFLVPSGDLPPVMDLLGLPPFTLPEMKCRVLDWITNEVRKDQFTLSSGEDVAFFAWVFADTCEGPMHAGEILSQANTMLGKLKDRKSLYSSHHAQRLGRLLFRLGKRRESIRCAKTIGRSPWQLGWQFQSIIGSVHARIRERLLRKDVIANTWETNPALACSAMTLPLWLVKPVNRVSTLMGLFNQAASCPWIFLRMHHVYQWHLALAGKQEALDEIETIAPDWGIGLAKSLNLKTAPE